MKLTGLIKPIVIGLMVVFLVMPVSIFAQTETPPVFNQWDLDRILAPVALYPDALLAQVLMASTYPLEIVMAARWVERNRDLASEKFNKDLDQQSWDPSVKALAPFPDILSMMSEDLDWTQSVGDAFLANETMVMETIQRLRDKAYAAGNLQSTQYQAVTREDDIIIIRPSSPQVVYVPTYNPMFVYGHWWYPDYPPVMITPYSRTRYISTGIIAFGTGIAVASTWDYGWGCWDWPNRRVYVNVNRPANVHYHRSLHTGKIRTTPWRHSPEHRRGVTYRDSRTRQRFAPVNRRPSEDRRNHRGYDRPKPTSRNVSPSRNTSRPTVASSLAPTSEIYRDKHDSQALKGSARGSESRSSSPSYSPAGRYSPSQSSWGRGITGANRSYRGHGR